MKVGTDAIVLSAVTANFFMHKSDKEKIMNILDAGTGSGIIALCMAQVFNNSKVHAIDIDKASYEQARDNFLCNKFSERMSAENVSLQNHSLDNNKKYDLIISNPPFFSSSLHSDNIRRNMARHDDNLILDDFVVAVKRLAVRDAYVCVILPCDRMKDLRNKFISQDIFPVFGDDVRSNDASDVKRQVCIFRHYADNILSSEDFVSEDLVIRDKNGKYTEDYLRITSLFLLHSVK